MGRGGLVLAPGNYTKCILNLGLKISIPVTFFLLCHLYTGSGRSACVQAAEVRVSRERLQSSCSGKHLRGGGSCSQYFCELQWFWGESTQACTYWILWRKEKLICKKKNRHKIHILMLRFLSSHPKPHIQKQLALFLAISWVYSVCGVLTGNSFSKRWD